MAKFCGQCGTENPDASRFCLHCGEPFGRVGAGSSPPIQGIPTGKRGINWALLIAIGTVVFLAALVYGQSQQPSGNQQANVVIATETPLPAPPTSAPPANVEATANSQDTTTARQAAIEQTAAALPTDAPTPIDRDTAAPVDTDIPVPAASATSGYHIAALNLVVPAAQGWAFYTRDNKGAVFQGPTLFDPNGKDLGRVACTILPSTADSASGAYANFKQTKANSGDMLVEWADVSILNKSVLLYLLTDLNGMELASGFFDAPRHAGVATIICSLPLATNDTEALLAEIGDAAKAWRAFAASIITD